ncbi:MAG: bacillithiol biosynthesis cysteine-adding enzyme BshC [Saprospiraceae bacterium]|nr:bacillithiol biosynthesis cysteine-adding enzyme BshC [Saprospiraceae bacterium]
MQNPNRLMEILKLPFEQVPQLSSKDTAYATGNPTLRPFYKYDVNIDAFAKVIEDKIKDKTNRPVLVNVLREQYIKITASDAVRANVEALLQENTFTVTTAHQPALFTGPLYYIYKIISTIHLAKALHERYPNYNFVPVFVNGAEDHDFEEINHANIFNKKIEWQSGEVGSCGMMKTESLSPVLEELKQILGESDNAQHLYHIIETAYTSHETYGAATVHLVNELFKEDGLVIIDMNNAQLKRVFLPIMEEELLYQSSQQYVESTQKKLEAVGFGSQAYVRDINLFYLRDQIRNRIVLEGDTYKVLNTDYSFSKDELLQELQAYPEHFSPNVVLRPLYQELILPNLAYIGGGGEIAYWLERKSQFEHFGINFPMLVRRNSVLWVDGGSVNRMQKLELKIQDLFTDTETLIKHYIAAHAENELSLEEEKAALEKLFEQVAAKAKEIDPTLEKSVLAEGAKQVKSLEQVESKIVRAEKQKHETALNQIRALRDKFFPNNGLQERTDNFAAFYIKYGDEFFDVLKANLDPLDKRFVIILDK